MVMGVHAHGGARRCISRCRCHESFTFIRGGILGLRAAANQCPGTIRSMNPLELVEIGRTGLRVTRLGLGGAPLGGLFSSVAEDDAAATVETAYRAGLRFYDTAPFYGHGRSEARLGRYLRPHPRDEYVLATKVGRVLVPAESSAIEDHRYRDVLPFNPVFDFSREGVLRSFEESLNRLGLERIDVLHIHDPDHHDRQALTEAFPALLSLKQQRLIRAIGAGMNQWEMLARFARHADFDCFLLAGRYTLLDQSALAELLPLCLERKISVILGGPYNSGILATGSGGGGHYNYEAAPPGIVARTRRIEEVARRHDVPLKAAALQFPLAHPAVAAVIPGARSAAEVAENVAMVQQPIPGEFWEELRGGGLIADAAPVPEGEG
jgi:D-threo-aldose 1-dehydrogenase